MKTSRPSWAKSTIAALKSPPDKPAKRLVILGIGNELNADDAVGVLAVRGLSRRLGSARPTENLLLIEAGPAPENFTAPLRRFQPDLVLLVDAVQMQGQPGEIAWLEWQQVDGFSASTHTLPPSVFSHFLVSELGCQVAMIGIQVDTVEFDGPIHPAVKRAAARLAGRLANILKSL